MNFNNNYFSFLFLGDLMFKSKNCLSCIDYQNCYVLLQLKRALKPITAISQIQITDFDFKCSHFHENMVQLKIETFFKPNAIVKGVKQPKMDGFD